MTTRSLTLVRIYVRESEHLLERVVRYLHNDTQAAGITVLRGIEGHAGSDRPQPAFLVDLSLDLPIIIEFLETPERADAIIHSLIRRFPLPHIVSWPAFGHGCSD
jgi:PII-like signaling protein